MQEVCHRFEFARHFESQLARPPLFYMRMRTTSDEHSIVPTLRSTRIIFSTYSFNCINKQIYIIYVLYIYTHSLYYKVPSLQYRETWR